MIKLPVAQGDCTGISENFVIEETFDISESVKIAVKNYNAHISIFKIKENLALVISFNF